MSDVNCFDLRAVLCKRFETRDNILVCFPKPPYTFKELFVYDNNNYCEKKVVSNVNVIYIQKKSTVGKRFKCIRLVRFRCSVLIYIDMFIVARKPVTYVMCMCVGLNVSFTFVPQRSRHKFK